MSPSSPLPLPQARRERVLLIRITIALGLALLLVIGAWSTSHGEAHVTDTLCVAAGHSAAGDTTGATAQEATIATGTLTPAGTLCLMAALCGVLLVLLFRRLYAQHARVRSRISPRAALPRLAGPRRTPFTLTLIQLSISRT